jgi:8-oxo-dGTP pyrophosphatase MutT (NUDIX family)
MGGPFWRGREAGAWSIIKGELAEGEEPLAAALREFGEETGLAVSGPFVPLAPVRQAGGKVVIAYAIEAPDSTRPWSAATPSRSSGRAGRAGSVTTRRSSGRRGSPRRGARADREGPSALLDELERDCRAGPPADGGPAPVTTTDETRGRTAPAAATVVTRSTAR